jgi:hypothetical protein
VVLSAGILAAFLSGNSIFTVLSWFSPLWRSIQFGGTVAGITLFEMIYPALELFAIFAQLLARLLFALLSLAAAGLRGFSILSDVPTPEIPIATEAVEAGGPAEVGKAITGIIMLVLIALVALALARIYRQVAFAARESRRSQVENIDADRPGLGRRVLERLGLFRQWRAAASIRRIYRLMCQSAAAAGYPRLETETPYEYLPTLARVWPDYASESRLITEAFVRIRYGELPETDEELESIRSAWRLLAEAEPNRRQATADKELTLNKRE